MSKEKKPIAILELKIYDEKLDAKDIIELLDEALYDNNIDYWEINYIRLPKK